MKEITNDDVLFGVRIDLESFEKLKKAVDQDVVSLDSNEILVEVSEDKYVLFVLKEGDVQAI